MKKHILLLLLFLIFTAIVSTYFYLAIKLPLFQWDEARLGVNALEMLKSHNLITTTYENLPDNWNTKPPFAIWMMCLSLKIFGYSELGLRFPSILFSILTLLFVTYVLRKENIFTIRTSILFVIILSTSIGFSGYHVAITADYDAFLVFFFTSFYISSYFALDYIGIDKNKFHWYSKLAIIFFTLGFFTKGIAICLSIPGLILYVLYSRKFKLIFNKGNYTVLIGVLISISLISFYYFYRNHVSPEYLKSVLENEFGGRFLQGVENHNEPFSYYIYNIFTSRFSLLIWILIIPIVFISKLNSDKKLKSISVFILFIVLNFLLVISLAKTKLEWYDAPIYPLLAILITFTLIVLSRNIKSYSSYFWTLVYLLLIYNGYSISIYYRDLLTQSKFPVEQNSALLKSYIEKYNPQRVDVICYGYQAHLNCYKLLLENKGVTLYTNTYEAMPDKSENVYISSETSTIDKIKTFYQYDIIDSNSNGYIFKINGLNELNIKIYVDSEKSKINSNKEWLNSITEKAQNNHISVQNQIINDIIYLSENGNKFINIPIKDYILRTEL